MAFSFVDNKQIDKKVLCLFSCHINGATKGTWLEFADVTKIEVYQISPFQKSTLTQRRSNVSGDFRDLIVCKNVFSKSNFRRTLYFVDICS